MLTRERLKELLTYDPDTGNFTRRVQKGNFKAGTIAGGISVTPAGYKQLCIDYETYYSHR